MGSCKCCKLPAQFRSWRLPLVSCPPMRMGSCKCCKLLAQFQSWRLPLVSRLHIRYTSAQLFSAVSPFDNLKKKFHNQKLGHFHSSPDVTRRTNQGGRAWRAVMCGEILTKVRRRYLMSSLETAAYLDDNTNIDTGLDSRKEQRFCSQTCSPAPRSTQPVTELVTSYSFPGG